MIQKLLLIAARIVSYLPRSLVLALGRLLGSGLYLCLPYRKDVAWYNLSQAFPDILPSARRAILHRTYKHFAMMVMDFLRIPALSPKNLGSLIELDETHIRELRESGNGALIMTGHLGNWELIIPALALRGYPIITVAVPQRGSGGALVNAIRASTGSCFISKRTPVRTMLRLLREGNMLILAGDQDARKSGIWVSLLGQLSSRPRGGAVFALKTGAPLLASWCLLDGHGRYHLSFSPISAANLPCDRDQAIQALTQRYFDALEAAVHQHPEQYLWFHRMWKTRPPEQRGSPNLPSTAGPTVSESNLRGKPERRPEQS